MLVGARNEEWKERPDEAKRKQHDNNDGERAFHTLILLHPLNHVSRNVGKGVGHLSRAP